MAFYNYLGIPETKIQGENKTTVILILKAILQ